VKVLTAAVLVVVVGTRVVVRDEVVLLTTGVVVTRVVELTIGVVEVRLVVEMILVVVESLVVVFEVVVVRLLLGLFAHAFKHWEYHGLSSQHTESMQVFDPFQSIPPPMVRQLREIRTKVTTYIVAKGSAAMPQQTPSRG